MSLLDDFLWRALFAGVGVALAAGPLGCFVLWRRMAYFGDATAHAAILGVAGALVLEVPILAGVLAAALGAAALVSSASGRLWTPDALLGVSAHAALALGLVAMAFAPGAVDLEGYLFGDILAVARADLAVIWGGAAAVLTLLVWRWRALVLSTVNADLAAAEGARPEAARLALNLALALLVALALKVVGALLITAMLIIPAAAARALARTPEAMALGAAALGTLSAVAGLGASWRWDSPAGPSVVVAATLALALAGLARVALRR
jgi:zinc transport system permease protein